MSEQANPTSSSGGRRSPLILTIAAVVLSLLVGGGGVFWWVTARADAHPAAHAPAVAVAPAGLIALDPFVVNLADPEENRFLRVTLHLGVADSHVAAEIGENAVMKVRLRSSILELLSTMRSEQLVSAEGKAALKKAIAERVNELLAPVQIIDVLFTDFVVQF